MGLNDVTDAELGIIAICRANAAEQRKEIRKTWRVGRFSAKFSWRSKSNLWGRFGGGWNWKVGMQASSWRCVILSLLICEITFYVEKESPDVETR